MPNKIGRNDPCMCGSGRKFKHCCLRLASATPVTVPATASISPLVKARAPKAREVRPDLDTAFFHFDQRRFDSLSKKIRKFFNASNFYVHCDHDYLYFEYDVDFGIRVSRRGCLETSDLDHPVVPQDLA